MHLLRKQEDRRVPWVRILPAPLGWLRSFRGASVIIGYLSFRRRPGGLVARWRATGPHTWRVVRVADRTGLENRRRVCVRGFESPTLRGASARHPRLAELADAPHSGCGVRKGVRVQVSERGLFVGIIGTWPEPTSHHRHQHAAGGGGSAALPMRQVAPARICRSARCKGSATAFWRTYRTPA